MSKLALAALAWTGLIGASAQSILPHPTDYVVPLTGQAEVNVLHPAGGTGDPDGTGRVRLSIDLDRRQICYAFDVSGLAMPLMAHIHRGAPLHTGPTVVTLFTGPGADLKDCLPWTEERLAEIVANPANFYVNLYTTEFPDGALRGQLPV